MAMISIQKNINMIELARTAISQRRKRRKALAFPFLTPICLGIFEYVYEKYRFISLKWSITRSFFNLTSLLNSGKWEHPTL